MGPKDFLLNEFYAVNKNYQENSINAINLFHPNLKDKASIFRGQRMAHKTIVLVLNYNGWQDTVECLESVLKQDNQSFDVVVVDNGSTDGSIGYIKKEFPNVNILQIEPNIGFTGGTNFGLRWAIENGYDFAFALSNDTVVLDNCIPLLVDELTTHPNTAAVAPRSYFYDNPDQIYFAGGTINSLSISGLVGMGKTDNEIVLPSPETEWLNGCAILFRITALEKIGLFAPEYFLLFEDNDWSYRATRSGYSLRCVPEAKLLHKVSQTFGAVWSPKYMYYFTRNKFLWIERNIGFPKNLRYFTSAFLHTIYQSIYHTRGKASDEKRLIRRAILKGGIDYLTRKFGEQTI